MSLREILASNIAQRQQTSMSRHGLHELQHRICCFCGWTACSRRWLQAIRDSDPERLVSALARAKAAAIRARLPRSDDQRVLITCDQGACNMLGQ